MSEIRKLPASAGAEWLLAGFALLRKAPMGLGALGMLWAAGALLLTAIGATVPVLALPAQLIMALAGPLAFGGLVWAAREVDLGRPAQPGHLLQGLHDGRAPHLLVALLPQLIAGLVLGILLLLLIGSQGLTQLSEVMTRLNEISQSGASASPAEMEALAASLPAGRILLWLLCVLAVFIAVALALFTLSPQVMFEQRGGWQSLRLSLRACLHNVLPMLLFFLLSFVSVFAVYFLVMIVAMIAQLLGGALLALVVAQILLMGVVMPVFAGAVYTAWKQMFGHRDAPAAVPVGPSSVFHA
ncbi:BPSS1780 family membrane protein [Xanthomonas sp. 60]